jgi:hypothetical protein
MQTPLEIYTILGPVAVAAPHLVCILILVGVEKMWNKGVLLISFSTQGEMTMT